MSLLLPPAVDECETELATADGVVLQALFHAPPAAAGSAVICHPHPLQGGNMNNKVVTTCVRAAASVELATLRFDFRGVGKSTGTYAGGLGEVVDVLAALERAERLVEAGQRALMGFSFGSAVSTRAVADGARVDKLILIGPPLTFIDFPTPKIPAGGLTVIVGDNDTFCPVELAEEFVARFADPLVELHLITGADHFFHSRLPQLAQAVLQALD